MGSLERAAPLLFRDDFPLGGTLGAQVHRVHRAPAPCRGAVLRRSAAPSQARPRRRAASYTHPLTVPVVEGEAASYRLNSLLQHATPRASSATPATRLTVTPAGVPGAAPSSSSTSTEGPARSTNPVAASSAPMTESSVRLDPIVPPISALIHLATRVTRKLCRPEIEGQLSKSRTVT